MELSERMPVLAVEEVLQREYLIKHSTVFYGEICQITTIIKATGE